ncbi:transmembrane protein, putative [Medicago truncatula]|uniref:Transmembrane protein, putative n=1 Tax=Medicago truncatula TaxID=3880 RepID=G7LCB9_MEDTR|nr:transmembrane protein, putative [Medicago truncatula]
MIRVSWIGYIALLISLLRQIIGSDFSDDNLWLCEKMVTLIITDADVCWCSFLHKHLLQLLHRRMRLLRSIWCSD